MRTKINKLLIEGNLRAEIRDTEDTENTVYLTKSGHKEIRIFMDEDFSFDDIDDFKNHINNCETILRGLERELELND